MSVCQQLVGAVLKSLGYRRKNRVLVHSRPSSIEVATTAFFLERRDRYDPKRRRFVFPLDETCYGRNGQSVYVCSQKCPVVCTIELQEIYDIII